MKVHTIDMKRYIFLFIAIVIPLFGVNAQVWLPGPPLPTPRDGMASVVIDSIMYLTGGNRYHDETVTTTDSVLALNLHTMQWMDSPPPLLIPRSHSAIAIHKLPGNPDSTIVYVIGGMNENGFVQEVEYWSPGQHFWLLSNPMPDLALEGSRAVLYNGEILVTGGRDTSAVHPYDSITRLVLAQEGTPVRTEEFGLLLPEPASHHSISIMSGKLYFMGGFDIGPRDAIYCYDDGWNYTGELDTPRGGMASTLLEDFVFLQGGVVPDPGDESESGLLIDSMGETLIFPNDLEYGRAYHSIGTYELSDTLTRIVVVGGSFSYDNNRVMVNEVWYIDVTDYYVATETLPPLPQPFHATAYPNPANGMVRISVDVSGSNDLNVTLYNLLGRQVTSWQIDHSSSPTVTLFWDGTINGTPAPAGSYFLRVLYGAEEQTLKIVRLP